jgi:predicted DNA-binding protein YlxM (UPF0122 family)
MQNNTKNKLKYYYKQREKQIVSLHQEKRNEFLFRYPNWDILKLLIKPTQRELLEKVYCLTPVYYSLVDIAEEKGVSRQAVYGAHKKALKALDKALMKLN